MTNTKQKAHQGHDLKRIGRSVTIVTGAPGSGKTTFVRNVITSDDLVVDLDRICEAITGQNTHQDHGNILSIAIGIRDYLYQAIEECAGTWKNAYIITSSPDRKVIDGLKKRFHATEYRVLASRDQCIDRIRNDVSRSGREDVFVNLANQWYDETER